MKQLILITSLLLALQSVSAQRSSRKRAEHNARIAERNAKMAEANALIAHQNALKAEENANKSNELSNNIINDLMSDSLISSSKNLNYELSNKEFIVNGKTMEKTVHQVYRDKYKPERGVTIVYYTASDNLTETGTKFPKQNSKKAKENEKKAEANALIAEKNAKIAEENAKRAEANAIIAEENARKAEANAIEAEKNAKQNENFIAQFFRDLYNDKIITDTNNVSVTYSDEKFIVNGKKIDKEIHDRYLKKYSREKGQTLSGTRRTKD